MILYEGILIRYLEEAQRICWIVQAQEMSDKAVGKNNKKKNIWVTKIQVSQRGLIIESLLMQTVKLVLKESTYKSILTRGYRSMWSLILLPWLDFLTQEQ